MSVNKVDFDSGFLQKIDSVGQTILFAVNDSFDSGLNDEFCTFYARGGSDIERSAVATVVGSGNFGDGICLGMIVGISLYVKAQE